MDYDKEQAGREVMAFQNSTGGLALQSEHERSQAAYIRQVFNTSTNISHILTNPADVAEAVARWQGIEFEKKRLERIKEEGKRNDG